MIEIFFTRLSSTIVPYLNFPWAITKFCFDWNVCYRVVIDYCSISQLSLRYNKVLFWLKCLLPGCRRLLFRNLVIIKIVLIEMSVTGMSSTNVPSFSFPWAITKFCFDWNVLYRIVVNYCSISQLSLSFDEDGVSGLRSAEVNFSVDLKNGKNYDLIYLRRCLKPWKIDLKKWNYICFGHRWSLKFIKTVLETRNIFWWT